MGHALGNNYGKFYSFLSKPVWLDGNWIVDPANGNGLGVRSVKGQGIENVFMHTTGTPGKGPNGYLNPNPAPGFALIQLSYNYNRYCGGFHGFVSPVTGGTIAINSTALTIGDPYVIVSPGHATAGTETIGMVADVAGSLASTWFKLYDGYGNTFAVWYNVSGTGTAPVVPLATLVEVQISTGDSAATVGSKTAVILNALTASQILNPTAPQGVFSFTVTGTTTLTLVSTQTNPYGPLPGVAADGTIPTGFTFTLVDFNSNLTNWQQVGLPKGVVPAIGASFIATATGSSAGGGSTGLVQAPGTSGVDHIEVIGDPNQSFGPIPMGGSPNVGGWLLVQFLFEGAVTAPTTNTVVGVGLYVEQATQLGQNGSLS
jgi:hypothetical protein